jgi:hypothetical protein
MIHDLLLALVSLPGLAALGIAITLVAAYRRSAGDPG